MDPMDLKDQTEEISESRCDTVAALGVLLGLAGFFGWPIHPDIIKFLT